MSASLVGSEMCIRDSGLSLGSRPRALRPVPEPPHRSRARGPGHLQAVSYTHLTLPTICSV
eukprot:14360241-Alexandrium_andersonii.AAC.1